MPREWMLAALIALGAPPAWARETTPIAPTHVTKDKGDVDVARLAYDSQSNPDFSALVADLATEIALAIKPLAGVCPLFLAPPKLSPNLGREAGEQLRFAVSGALERAGLAEVAVISDDTVAFAHEEKSWRVARGGATASDAKKVAETIGAQSIVHLSLSHEAAKPDKLVVDLLIVDRAGQVVLARTIESDDTRTLLDRPSDGPLQTADERKRDLLTMLHNHGNYGQAALIGSLQIPLQVAGFQTSINSITFAYRLYETFGPMKDFLLGLQVQGFIDIDAANDLKVDSPVPISIAGGIVGIVFAYTLPIPDLRLPRIRLGATAGGFIGGSLGNNAAGGGMVELLMRYRLGLNFSLIYIGVSDLSKLFGTSVKFGGLSYMFAGSLNWD